MTDVSSHSSRRVTTEDCVRGGPTRIREDQLATLGLGHEPVGGVAAETDAAAATPAAPDDEADRDSLWTSDEAPRPDISDDSLVNAKQSLVDAVDELVGVLGSAQVRSSIGATDRANLAKYLTIAKLRLENAIALIRSDDAGY